MLVFYCCSIWCFWFLQEKKEERAAKRRDISSYFKNERIKKTHFLFRLSPFFLSKNTKRFAGAVPNNRRPKRLVEIDKRGTTVDVQCQVAYLSFSAHADAKGIADGEEVEGVFLTFFSFLFFFSSFR